MQTIDHAKYMQLIEPAFPDKMTHADKRNNIVVQSEDYIYIRWVTAETQDVPRFPLPAHKE